MDCIVIGYYDQPLDLMLASMKPMASVSGGWRYLHMSSVSLDGKQLDYSTLLNSAVSAATGQPSSLHTYRLPNLAAYYLASFLRKHGLQSEVVNLLPHDMDRFLSLMEARPRAVAITTTFYFDPAPIAYLTQLINKYSPQTKVVVGGPYIFKLCSMLPPESQDDVFAEIGADIYVNDGQGETTLLRVCQELRKPHPDLTTVGNLAVRTGKTFTRTPRVLEHNDLDASAMDYTLFPTHETAPASQVRTARSCAFKCSFCSFPVIAGAHEIMSLPALERSLDHLRQTGTTHLFFIDDTFNVPLKPFRDLCRLMIEKQYGFEWVCQFRCGNAQDEDFDLLAEAGCIGVLLGIESAAPDILRLMNKGVKVDRYREGIAKLKARGIITYASFIAGFPGETAATFDITRDFIRSERPDYYVIEPYFHDPRVPIAERSAEFGLRGASYSWQHKTMNWKQAFDHAETAYKTITESTILPLQSADLWTLAYLRSAGFSMELIRGFTQLAARMLVQSLRGEGHDNTGIFQKEMVPLFRQHLGARAS
ncbi:MAG TPA: radical SAM protein [Steroidobacter sp.]|uniref:radical SAM protein n=1 Tax=Steroidobacter sp. TaxID=1978227 RepID=UPI002EDB94B0